MDYSLLSRCLYVFVSEREWRLESKRRIGAQESLDVYVCVQADRSD